MCYQTPQNVINRVETFTNPISFRNKSFKAKGIRTDTPLYQGNQTRIDVLTQQFQKMSLQRGSEHRAKEHKNPQDERIVLKMDKAKNEQRNQIGRDKLGETRRLPFRLLLPEDRARCHNLIPVIKLVKNKPSL